VAVVVPAYNEADRIVATLRSVPRFVDHVVLVDDASTDGTVDRARRLRRRGLHLVRHTQNRGVGAAIVTGYQRAFELGVDMAAVMAGDGQMDPQDLPRLLDPLVEGACDYVKGNRFAHPELPRAMPWLRIAGNVVLSLVTRVTSGYWGLFDSQCGYTAIAPRALSAIDLRRVFPRYGYLNDLLARLHAADIRIQEVPVRPVYGPGWRSGIRLHTVVYPIAFVLVRSMLRRLAREWGGVRRRRAVAPGSGSASGLQHALPWP
jgi:glycosyltransferase involved in cell wall biosynthesis